jgi:hypothetical protein
VSKVVYRGVRRSLKEFKEVAFTSKFMYKDINSLDKILLKLRETIIRRHGGRTREGAQ